MTIQIRGSLTSGTPHEHATYYTTLSVVSLRQGIFHVKPAIMLDTAVGSGVMTVDVYNRHGEVHRNTKSYQWTIYTKFLTVREVESYLSGLVTLIEGC